MTKLTDLQTILLSSAAQRADGSLLPPPQMLGAAEHRIPKAIATLIKRTYAREVAKAATDQAWRVDGDRHYGAEITDAGRAAVVGASTESPTNPSESGEPRSRSGAVRPTKAALVLSLLRRKQGATLAELIEATGWLPHTTRAALTGIRKKGHNITKGKRGDVTCYWVAG